MSVQDVILFVSSTSEKCGNVVGYIRQNNMPVRLVRLDTVADRIAAANGPHVQIHTVPSLLIIYEDSNIQLYVGQDKILEWLQSIISSRSRESHPQASSPSSQVNHRTVLIPEDVSDEEDVQIKKPKKSRSKKSKRSDRNTNLYGGKTKKSRSKHQESDTDEVEIEFIDDGRKHQRPKPPPTQGLMVGPQQTTLGKKKSNSRMGDLYSLAKQMEKDRQSTLGYDEKDLPVST